MRHIQHRAHDVYGNVARVILNRVLVLGDATTSSRPGVLGWASLLRVDTAYPHTTLSEVVLLRTRLASGLDGKAHIMRFSDSANASDSATCAMLELASMADKV